MRRRLLGAVALSAIMACSGEIVFPGKTGGPSGGVAGATIGAAGGGSGATGASGASAGSGGAVVTDAGPDVTYPDFGTVGGVPTHAPELLEYLQAGQYQSFPLQSEAVYSTSHGATRLYFNSILADSLEADNADHPEGAVAIRENFWSVDEADLVGWEAAIKIQPDTADGDGWFWYTINIITGTQPSYARTGAAYCLSCHRGALHDCIHATIPMHPG